MYKYVLKMEKDHREETKEQLPEEFTEHDVIFTIDAFESGRPLWKDPEKEIRELVKDKLEYITEEDLPDGHELEDEEHVRLIVDWDSDKVVFEDDVTLRRAEQNQPRVNRRRF